MKKLMLFCMWISASAAAVLVAWAGVSVVDNQVVAPPQAVELVALTTNTEATTPGSSDDSGLDDSGSDDSGSDDSGSTSTTLAQPPSTATPGVTTSTIDDSSSRSSSDDSDDFGPDDSSSNSSTSTTVPQTTSTTTPSNTTPSTSSTSTTQPAAPTTTAAPATTQTFVLTGGTTAVSFSASGVQVLWATPNPGFGVKIEPESPGFKVEFRSDDHRSRIDVWWSNGPQRSIREEADD